MALTARRSLLAALLALGLLAVGCGGGEPEGEATWETHTTAPAQSAGAEEAAAGDGSAGGGEAAEGVAE